MTNDINLIEFGSACSNNASINSIIEKLKLINYQINLCFTGDGHIDVTIIINKNILIFANIRCEKYKECDLFNLKVADGWQFKINR